MSSLSYTLHLSEIPEYQSLAELALDLRWAWTHAGDEMWKRLDPELWELTQNPWVVLQTVSRERLQQAIADPVFREHLDELLRDKHDLAESPAWFQKAHPNGEISAVAYFSMEFMLSEAMPIYSGGLGNVAGDQLKAASDLGVPVIGVGLLYQQGYFRQEIDADGRQYALYPFNDPGQLPIQAVRDQHGEWLRVRIAMPGFRMWVRVWQAQVGRTLLYLLDTNDPANLPEHRGIAAELYGGGPEVRLKQEIVLGIGGWRLLRAVGLRPEVCHLNEGHAGFAVLERARSEMEETHQPFEAALNVTRAGNLFTTHTPVEAGFDRFAPELMEKYFKGYAEHELGLPFQKLMALGRRNPGDGSEPFNMAYLAIRGSGGVNGVSRLHGEVSRRIFQVLFPRWPVEEVPVGHVTNGVHMPTWDSEVSDAVWTACCGKERWRESLDTIESDLRCASDSQLWEMRMQERRALVDYVRERLARQFAGHGALPQEVEEMSHVFDANILTLGFARRFATYKRPNLLLHDPDRLIRILTHPERPVQLILAGKAHPQDIQGQEMVRRWVDFVRHSPARSRAVFLSDYDMHLTLHLVQGVDVWINTPRRPWEASGTSGMKALVNGALNLSELDGWWAEAYAPDVGWAIGDGREHGEDPAWDAAEAEVLYRRLEEEIIPDFYSRDDHGIPVQWVARMRESMARLAPQFSTNRSLRQYTEEHYLPAAAAYRARGAENGKPGADLLAWQREIELHWPRLHFGPVKVETSGASHEFQVHVYLNDLDPDAVCVELYAAAQDSAGALRSVMQRGQRLIGSENGFTYTARVAADRPAADFTPRVVPCRAGVSVPLEAPRILWEH
jgi:glycogen phosphorylase